MSKLVLEKNNLVNQWIKTDLENCVQILDGKRKPVNSLERGKRQGEIPYYGATGQVGWIDDYLFDEELVLLGEDGAPFFESSKNKAFLIQGKSWVNNHAHVLKAIAGVIENKYLCYYLNQFDYHDFVNGTTRLKLNQSNMKSIPILLAPLNEQKRIVEKIEELFSNIEEDNILLQNIKNQLETYRKSILENAFNGNLSQDWRKNNFESLEDATDMIDRIKLFDSDDEIPLPLVELPKKWILTTLGKLFRIKPGSTPSRRIPEYWQGDIPWISSGEVKNCEIFESEEKISPIGLENSSAVIHPPETVLLAMIGEGKTRGKTAILKISAATNQNVAAILCKNSEILSRYLFWWLVKRYDETRKSGSGGMQPALNSQRVRNLPFIVAPTREQKVITSIIDLNMTHIDNLEKIIIHLQNQLQILKKTILKLAFEGKLVPQDFNEEPAEILLEKIKLEKQKIIKAKPKPRRKKNDK